MLNKDGAQQRDHVLFINADRAGQNIDGYAKRVPAADIKAEDYNCNIRRYVDNAPPPEPHDVRAHLHGGVPVSEFDAQGHFWQNYAGLRESIFVPRATATHGISYADFAAPPPADKRDIAPHINSDASVTQRHAQFMTDLADWWQQYLPVVEALAPDADNQHATGRNVYAVRATLLDSIERTFAGQHLLNRYQVRGAFANYFKGLVSDFKSIAASGWGPELIPDEDILQSQFPEVLAELETQHARLAERQALFAAASEEDFEDADDTGVLPADEVQFANGQRVLDLAASVGHASTLASVIEVAMAAGQQAKATAERIESKLATRKALEDEAKTLKAAIKSTAAKKDELVEQARLKISKDEARQVIVERLGKLLFESYRQYLRADLCACIAAVENLLSKYAVTANQIEAERDETARVLQGFLVELGYE